MRILCVPKQFYQASRLNGQPLSQKAIFRLEKIKLFLGLKGKGLSSKEILEVLPIKKSTLYRWLAAYKKHGPRGLEPRSTKPHRIRNTQYDLMLVRKVLYLRHQHPMWGKAKITWLLRKEGTYASESTVGRILSNLMRKGRIMSTWALRKQCPVFYKKRKANRKHAIRLPKGLKPETPGEIVQVDTMTLNLFSGFRIKQFTAYCPVSKITVADVYRRATAFNASKFLEHLIEELPFELRGIQVDGGSEFMAEFEDRCQEKDLRLYVLPPRSPKLNGSVERANGAWRYEFYWSDHLLLNMGGVTQTGEGFSKAL